MSAKRLIEFPEHIIVFFGGFKLVFQRKKVVVENNCFIGQRQAALIDWGVCLVKNIFSLPYCVFARLSPS